MLAGQLVQGAAAKQRHVAVGDDDLALDEADGLDHGLHGMTRAALPVLDHDFRLRRLGGDVRGYLVPAVADHDHQALRAEFARGGQRVTQHATAA